MFFFLVLFFVKYYKIFGLYLFFSFNRKINNFDINILMIFSTTYYFKENVKQNLEGI